MRLQIQRQNGCGSEDHLQETTQLNRGVMFHLFTAIAALFLSEIVKPIGKKYECGWIPHYQDIQICPRVFYKGKLCKTIDPVNKNPLEVAREISQCKRIISTSLHGIIVAHAYGIPAARVVLSKLHGSGVKFQDHYESIGLKLPLNSLLNWDTKEVYEAWFSTPGFIDMSKPREVLKKMKKTI